MPGHEQSFMEAFFVEQIGTSEYFLPPSEQFPEGMKFTLSPGDVETVSEIVSKEDSKLMAVLQQQPNFVFFAGVEFDQYDCGENVDLGDVVEKCSTYTEAGVTLSKKSVATENYSKCKPVGAGNSCKASRKEVGKTQHYKGHDCDKNQPVGEPDKFYDWVCQ